MKVGCNSIFQKKANSLLILEKLREKSYSRLELSKTLGLQPSTLTYSVNRLLKAGLVKEEKTITKGVGRPNVYLSLNKDFATIIGIELLQYKANITLMDFKANVISHFNISFESSKEDNFKDKIKTCINSAIEKTSNSVLACLIAVPGVVDKTGVKIIESQSHNIKDLDLKDFLASFSFPVLLENDANCCSSKFLYSNKDQSYIYVMMHHYKNRVSLGTGLVFNGELYKGKDSKSGEIYSPFTKDLSQFSSNIVDLEDKEKTISFLRELMLNLRFSIGLLDPSKVLLGGDLALFKKELNHLIDTEFNNKEIKDVFTILDDTLFDACDGAAMLILNKISSVPKIGDNEKISVVITSLL